jgi:hypothetical protein
MSVRRALGCSFSPHSRAASSRQRHHWRAESRERCRSEDRVRNGVPDRERGCFLMKSGVPIGGEGCSCWDRSRSVSGVVVFPLGVEWFPTGALWFRIGTVIALFGCRCVTNADRVWTCWEQLRDAWETAGFDRGSVAKGWKSRKVAVNCQLGVFWKGRNCRVFRVYAVPNP